LATILPPPKNRRALVFAALFVVACQSGPSAEQADRAALGRVVDADALLDQELQRADGLSKRGDSAGAAEVLEKAVPLADRACAAASASRVSTPWGAAHRDEWIRLSNERKGELTRYAGALRSGDPEALLAALEAQLALQRRTADAARAVHGR
jgi:hypothetical protein